MDLKEIGKFISELRKEKGFSQEQLGEKIGVTNKTVSRWETGVYLPPADMLLAMSELFSVSINEILSGRRLAEDEYKQAAEENLSSAIRVRRSVFGFMQKNKCKIIFIVDILFIVITSVLLLYYDKRDSYGLAALEDVGKWVLCLICLGIELIVLVIVAVLWLFCKKRKLTTL